MYAQLGDIRFDAIKSPRSWSESHEAKFGEIAHVGRKPALQFTGEGLSGIELTVRFSSDFCDPSEEIIKLYKAKAQGQVLPLITGVGVLVGKFVITTIDTKVEKTTPEGELIAASLDIALKEYAPPPGSKEPNQGEAVTGIRNKETPARPVTTEPQALSRDILKGTSSVNGMVAVLSAIKRGTLTFKQGVRMVKQLANTAKMAYNDAALRLYRAKKIKERTKQLPTSLDGAIGYAENIMSLGDLANLSSLEFTVNTMVTHSSAVMQSATPVAAFVGTREGGS